MPDSETPIRDLIEAIHEALYVPQPAAMEDWELRQGRAMTKRAAGVRGVLESVLDQGVTDGALRSATGVITRYSAEPLPYEPVPGENPGRCAACGIAYADIEFHFCHEHQRWECRDVSRCTARIRAREEERSSDGGL